MAQREIGKTERLEMKNRYNYLTRYYRRRYFVRHENEEIELPVEEANRVQEDNSVRSFEDSTFRNME